MRSHEEREESFCARKERVSRAKPDGITNVWHPWRRGTNIQLHQARFLSRQHEETETHNETMREGRKAILRKRRRKSRLNWTGQFSFVHLGKEETISSYNCRLTYRGNMK
ncbi:hypothetical protein AVEN_48546-1 [Araneus ventricosus]|uniref:Uncharacterized protein n=1 Tax=Araneus ventricosus TaxID=182803 RepID=A0A4Y2NXY3_ARAVE|nr:hypothetical protein AVEN_48546-1 [Araneus ventricosus]